jgi:hypothetical protein
LTVEQLPVTQSIVMSDEIRTKDIGHWVEPISRRIPNTTNIAPNGHTYEQSQLVPVGRLVETWSYS